MKSYNFVTNSFGGLIAVDVELAKDYGLDEAIVISVMAKKGEGYHRIPFKDWETILPFFSISKIHRLIRRMEDNGWLESTTEFNQTGLDKTKSYRLGAEFSDVKKLKKE